MRQRTMGKVLFATFTSIVVLFCLGACSSDSPTCGDGVREGDEECDSYDYGGQTCEGLSFNGGHLYCTEQCTIDTRSCHNCEENPCRGVDCSGHGRCINYEDKCIGVCECEEGYVATGTGQCVEEGSCMRGGQPCENDEDCCMGLCLEGYWGDTSYCVDSPCVEDSDCINHSADGREMYCNHYESFYPDEMNNCIKLPAGVSPGDRSGTCGDNCTNVGNSGCASGYMCNNMGPEDPTAYCTPMCETDADCQSCLDPAGNWADAYCYDAGTYKLCVFNRITCGSTADCPEDLSCIYTETEGEWGGGCIAMGGLAPYEECQDISNEDFSSLPYDERCQSGACINGHCSEWCTTQEDCGEFGLCGTYAPNYNWDLTICHWAKGSQDPCSWDGDCPAGEICDLVKLVDGEITKFCREQNCDPAEEDCLALGEHCEMGSTPCYNGKCYDWYTITEGGFCSAECSMNDQCPVGMFCVNVPVGDEVWVGRCAPIDGSGASCTSGADCPTGETCRYYESTEGLAGFCESYDEEAGVLGDVCEEHLDCRDRWCMDMETGTQCTEYCSSDADCPLPYHCLAVVGSEGEAYTGVCVASAGSGRSCERPADCDEGETCAVANGIDQLLTVCMELLPEGGEAGDPCSGYTCKTRLCTGTHCSYICAEDADCWEGSYCAAAVFPFDPDLVTSICANFPGSITPCDTDADCAEEEACSIVLRKEGNSIAYRFACTTRVPMAGRTGQACTTESDCYNRFCGGFGLEYQCSEACMSDAECPADMYCAGMYFASIPEDTGYCAPRFGTFTPCADDGDCGTEGEICAHTFPLGEPVGAACSQAIEGAGQPGTICTSDSQCISKFCSDTLGLCMTPCDDDGDCTAYGLVCGTADTTSGLTYSACVPQ